MATSYARSYQQDKAKRRETTGDGARAIPGVNHPVFRGKPVNTDPREAFVGRLMQEREERNIFHDYYRAVVQALFDQGVTNNVFCVNVDGVIAAWLLKLLWQPYRSGEFGPEALESAAFTIFLLARMAGSAAEIEDHLNRGRNMDTRTAASQVRIHQCRERDDPAVGRRFADSGSRVERPWVQASPIVGIGPPKLITKTDLASRMAPQETPPASTARIRLERSAAAGRAAAAPQRRASRARVEAWT